MSQQYLAQIRYEGATGWVTLVTASSHREAAAAAATAYHSLAVPRPTQVRVIAQAA